MQKNSNSQKNPLNSYEELRGEIFNPIEQKRLRKKLRFAVDNIKTESQQLLALDYGCGSGNITNHFIEFGIKVISVDISKTCLDQIQKKFERNGLVSTLKVNGKNLAIFNDNHFDIVATYSVLHHIPDYLKIVKEMTRVVKPGGIIYIDHEMNGSYWSTKNNNYNIFKNLALRKREIVVNNYRSILNRVRTRFINILSTENVIDDIKEYLTSYYRKIRLIINKRFMPEGDIHIWPDDHIDWDSIEGILKNNHCKLILKEDYLLFRRDYSLEIYNNYKEKCSDIRLIIARKNN